MRSTRRGARDVRELVRETRVRKGRKAAARRSAAFAGVFPSQLRDTRRF